MCVQDAIIWLMDEMIEVVADKVLADVNVCKEVRLALRDCLNLLLVPSSVAFVALIIDVSVLLRVNVDVADWVV